MLTRSDIRLIRSLTDKRCRDEEGLFVAEGRKLVEELRASHLRIRRIYTCDERCADELTEVVGPKEMERISLLKTPSDMLAVVEIPRYAPDPDLGRDELVLALDEVQNPGNLGTIVRLADWFGIRDVVCSPASADCFNPKVVQATMGAILRVRVHYTDLESLLASVAVHRTPVYGTFLDGENIYRADLTPAGIVVMGNEGRGIGESCARSITRRLFIPPFPAGRRGSESLNVAVATAVICSEFRRRSFASL